MITLEQICKEEIFGPVMCILKFKCMYDVIKRANDSIFGLVGTVYIATAYSNYSH